MQLKVVSSAALALILLTPFAAAIWSGLELVPIERILPQLEARVAKDARDAHGQYLLGRLHGAAFARDAASVCMYRSKDFDSFRTPEGDGPIAATEVQKLGGDQTRLGPELVLAHLTDALRHLSIAVDLAPQDGLYHLGLACALDSGAPLSAQVDSTVLAAALLGKLSDEERQSAAAELELLGDESAAKAAQARSRLAALGIRSIALLDARRADSLSKRREAVGELLSSAWHELAILHYERAFTLAFGRDSKLQGVMDNYFPALVSHESATSYIRLVRARGVRGEAEEKRLAEIESGLATLDKLPKYVTPILVPERADATLAGLFDDASATFDLAGIGVAQTWPWPTGETSFLVWDPECSGEVRSGRQLFGSSTWWMLFEDGYRALEALDADENGWLTGAELDGLALWRDADRDSVSDAGEVVPLAQRGVVAIATRADGIEGLSPTCARGALFDDGEMRPTFDWVATPLLPRP